jgi:hypothetical protein
METRSNIIRVVLVAALISLVPLLAMQVTDEVAWDETDFLAAFGLLAGAGLGYELVVKKVRTQPSRAALGAALVGALLLVWMELAVGVFGTPLAGQ